MWLSLKGDFSHKCEEQNHKDFPYQIQSPVDRPKGETTITLNSLDEAWGELELYRWEMEKFGLTAGEAYHTCFKFLNVCSNHIYDSEVMDYLFKFNQVSKPTASEFDKQDCQWIEAQAIIESETNAYLRSLN